MIDTKRLRQKILDLAIRGKLVPQDPADEPASVLLERIRAEKLQMVVDGRLKKKDVAKDSVIYRGDENSHYEKVGDGEPVCIDDELPFELPSGWEWARLGSIAYVAAGSTPPKNAFCEQGIPYYKMYNLRNNRIDFFFQPQYIDSKWHYGKLAKSIIYPGDLIMNIVGPPLGKLAIAPSDFPEANTNQAAVIIRPYGHFASVEWIRYFLMEMTEINRISTRGSAGQINISLTQSKMMHIPVPPIAEQQRIVAALDEHLGLVDEIERSQEELETLLAKARSKVLDLAIRGKLVPQDPTDEPASALLERIRAEKLKMVADGRLKKKNIIRDSVIYRGEDNSYYECIDGNLTCTEVPYRLPESWVWCRFGIINLFRTKTENPLVMPGKEYELYSVPSMENNEPEYVTGKEIGSSKILVDDGDVLLCKINPRINRVWQVRARTSRTLLASSEWIVFRNPLIDPQYMTLCLQAPFFREQLLSNVSGVGGSLMRAQPTFVQNYFIAIPPVTEQKRIIDKAETVLGFITSLITT